MQKVLFINKITNLIIVIMCQSGAGFGAEYIMQISQKIAKEMIDTQPYIQAVLGEILPK
ncbi:MAG TPA: hypothetical protein PLC65_20830 [Bacteroidia bacterium]|nr:hypothetical protein [Bacteroidia bacterium]